MLEAVQAEKPEIDPRKFRDPDVTAKGERRAVVALTRLKSLWFNTGSLCNITCNNCYMDSSPANDRLSYITAGEVGACLDEVQAEDLPVEEIAFTGGEPFMNPDLPAMVEDSLQRGYRALVLTNAMLPMHHKRRQLLDLERRFPGKLTLRVSVDHYTPEKHDEVRGAGSWAPMLKGLKWLAENGFALAVAGRTLWNETDEEARQGYAALFAEHRIPIEAGERGLLVLFPEMDARVDVPEITVSCWEILGVAPETMMCATSRMVIKRRGAAAPVVVPCTLLPYDTDFELGGDLAGAAKTVKLNHPHCATFCVLGGGSCTAD